MQNQHNSINQNKKIAIIIQRYGKQVNGGAEVHAKMIAEQLTKFYDVTILTTCAVDYKKWLPVLPSGFSNEGDIKILRFANGTRNPKVLNNYIKKITGTLLIQKIYKKLKYPSWMLRVFSSLNNDEQKDHDGWLNAQGPSTPEMIDYLKANGNAYNAFIFFTAIYYPTALGILEVAKKSILIPTLHNESVSYFPGYKKTMAAAEWIFFNTNEEMKLAEKIFPILTTKKQIVAVGITLQEKNGTEALLLKKVKVQQPYLVYVGRVDNGKGCDILIDYFIKCIEEFKLTISLVMVGKINRAKKIHPLIIYTDFVDEETKVALMQQALALVIPSEFESLSLVLLESFACKTSVIANGKSEVLKNHINKSNGGWCFETYTEFKNVVLSAYNNPNENDIKAKNGFNYVAKNYSWQNVVNKFIMAIEDIENSN